MQIYQIEIFETSDGKCPYSEWLDGLSDRVARAKIRTRLDRASFGNFGKKESVGAGVHELKIDFGPGYRIYFALDEDEGKIILLLSGGTKKRQQKDIDQAQVYWKQAKAEKREKRRREHAKKKLS